MGGKKAERKAEKLKTEALAKPLWGVLQERSQNTACRAASPRRNEGVTGNENPGCLSSSSSSSSSEIEYEADDEDDPSRQLEVIGKPAARLRREQMMR